MLERIAAGEFPRGFEPKGPFLPQVVFRTRWERNLTCVVPHYLNRNVRGIIRAINTLGRRELEVPPRVIYALIRLGYHAWPTKSRCGKLRHRCCLCDLEQGDSLNHICRCRVVREAFVRYAVCSDERYCVETFWLCGSRLSQNDMVVSAILVASFYKLLNKLRHGCRHALRVSSQIDKYIDDTVHGSRFSLLSTYTRHSYQQYVPHSYQHFAILQYPPGPGQMFPRAFPTKTHTVLSPVFPITNFRFFSRTVLAAFQRTLSFPSPAYPHLGVAAQSDNTSDRPQTENTKNILDLEMFGK